WNQLDLAIVLLSVMGITLEEIEISAALPINPTIIRIMRVLRIARVLKLLKMATGMRALLDTVVQALPQRVSVPPAAAHLKKLPPSEQVSRAEQSRAEQSRAEQSRAEPSRAEPSRAEQSRAEQSRAEQSRAELSRAEQSRAEQSRAELHGAVQSCSHELLWEYCSLDQERCD
ncbi:voltage-dependent T-type calcium channel subunit alpha-1I-like, partial, partial [Tachysurus ichikawai]